MLKVVNIDVVILFVQTLLGPSPCSISSDKSNETKDDGNGMAKKQGYVLGKTAE